MSAARHEAYLANESAGRGRVASAVSLSCLSPLPSPFRGRVSSSCPEPNPPQRRAGRCGSLKRSEASVGGGGVGWGVPQRLPCGGRTLFRVIRVMTSREDPVYTQPPRCRAAPARPWAYRRAAPAGRWACRRGRGPRRAGTAPGCGPAPAPPAPAARRRRQEIRCRVASVRALLRRARRARGALGSTCVVSQGRRRGCVWRGGPE